MPGGGAVVQITDSTVSGNTAALDGGGIFTQGSGSSVSIARSILSGNTAGRHGGGISVGSGSGLYPGLLSLQDSTISDNTATSGGGIYAEPASLVNITLTGTNTFTNNIPENCIGVAGC